MFSSNSTNSITHSLIADNNAVVPTMKLSPNVGSDRSWVWNATADVSDGEPEACTLAIRFANSDSESFFRPTIAVICLTIDES